MVTPTPETRALIQDLLARTKSPDLSWPELRAYYGGIANQVYEAKVAGNKELAATLEQLRDTMVEALAAGAALRGMEREFEEAMAMEKAIERRTFFLCMTANRMKAVQPAMFSLELLGSGAVVIAIMYFVLRSGPEWALLCGILLMAARYFLPGALDRMALNQERGLRELRKVPPPGKKE